MPCLQVPLSNSHVKKLYICILGACDVNLFLNCNRVYVYTVLGYAPGTRWSGWMYAIRRVTSQKLPSVEQ